MKLIYSIALLLLSFQINGQNYRYLTYVFPQIDSLPDIQYGSAVNYNGGNQALMLDFYQPHGDTQTKRPLLIYVHGGGFNTGSRKLPSIRLFCGLMAMKGYVTASIDYRLDPNFQIYNSNTDRRAMTDGMHDLRAAIRYFKANCKQYGIDTSRIFIGGESAGAATAMMASYVDKQSELAVYPKTNPYDIEGNSGNPGYSSRTRATLCLCGLLLDTTAMESSNDNPFLWLHGSKDSYIPMWFADNINKRAANIGLYHQRFVYQDADHCPWYYNMPNWTTYLDSTIKYVTVFLYPFAVQQQGVTTSLRATEEEPLMIFPNPVQGSIEITTTARMVKAEIINAAGRLTREFEGKSSTLSVEDLPPGIYYLKVLTEDSQYVRKFIKQ